MSFYHYFFALVFLCFSCNQQKTTDTPKADIPKKSSAKLKKEDIENIEYAEYILDSRALNEMSDWSSFQELSKAIEDLKKLDFSFYKDNKKRFDSISREATRKIPQAFREPAIQARLKVLETKMYKLRDAVNLNNIKNEDLLKNIEECLVAYSNLNFQINKSLEIKSQNIEKPQ